MAVTTAVTLNAYPATIYPGTVVNGLLTVTNNGAVPVSLTHAEVIANNLNSGIVITRPKLAQGQTATIAPSGGTSAFTFSMVPLSPLSNDGLAGSAPSVTNAISVNVFTSDGQAVADASGASFTATAPVYNVGGGG